MKAYAQEALEILKCPDQLDLINIFEQVDDSYFAETLIMDIPHLAHDLAETSENLDFEEIEAVKGTKSNSRTASEISETHNYGECLSQALGVIENVEHVQEFLEEGSKPGTTVEGQTPLMIQSKEISDNIIEIKQSREYEISTDLSESRNCRHILTQIWIFALVTLSTLVLFLNFDYMHYNRHFTQNHCVPAHKRVVSIRAPSRSRRDDSIMKECIANMSQSSKMNQISIGRIENLEFRLDYAHLELQECKTVIRSLRASLQLQSQCTATHNITSHENSIHQSDRSYAGNITNLTVTSNSSKSSFHDKSEDDIAVTAARRRKREAAVRWRLFL
uniref:Uncharacterized protein n=1 Tax=Guillardia theta TaxID=55529 RepID=A0A7S4KSI8_GUITH